MQHTLTDGFHLNSPELFTEENMLKSGSKTGSPYYFLNSRGQKIENIANIEQKTSLRNKAATKGLKLLSELHCIVLFPTPKSKDLKIDLGECYQFIVSIEISLDLKVYFSLVTYKINKLTALHSTNQITEISKP